MASFSLMSRLVNKPEVLKKFNLVGHILWSELSDWKMSQ